MKKILSLIMAAALMMGCMAPAFALDASNQQEVVDGQGTSDVVVERAEAVQMTVTVPVQLPMAVAEDGSTTVADNAKIVNKSYSPVKVSTYSIESKDGWQLVDETHDFSKDNVGTKNFYFTLSENVYNVINGRSEQPFTYDGKISGQKVALDNAVIGTVLWNIGWNGEPGGTETGGSTGGTDTPEPEPEEPVTYTDFTVTEDNRAAVGYTGAEGENLVIPATFVGDGNNGTEAGVDYKVTTIGEGAFWNCRLSSVTLPEGVTSIGNDAFYCSSLASVALPNTLTTIGENAFYSCFYLTSVNIPKGVTSIGRYAFHNCGSLTSIDIPEGVTSIEMYTFNYCVKLTSVTLPEGLETIGKSAFSDCDSLTDITYTGTKEQWNAITIDRSSDLTGKTVHCSDGDITA